MTLTIEHSIDVLNRTGFRRMGILFVLLGRGLLFNQKRKKSKVMLPVLRYGSYKWCIPVNCHLTVGIKVYQNLKKKRGRVNEHSYIVHHIITHNLKLDANIS